MSPQPSILFVFGTRPECIKLAPLILEAQKRNLKVSTCFTGQHKEMAQPILDFFKIKIDYSLEIMKPGQTLNEISQALFAKLEPVLRNNKFDHLVVQGDTTTAAVSAMMAFQNKINVIHVEAGLRTNDLQSPWPEEFNRRVISLAAKWHFAPTEKSVENLKQEGIPTNTIYNVGNTGIDALRLVVDQMNQKNFKYKNPDEFLILVTLHRRENFGEEMQKIMSGLKIISQDLPKVKIVWPLHQNPNVKKAFDEVFTEVPKNIILENPLNYFDFVSVMSEADLIVTDSGGVQEEAPFLGKPILVCRNSTERPESIECGSAELVGTCQQKLITKVKSLYMKEVDYQKMAVPRQPYGDGFASKRILDVICAQ